MGWFARASDELIALSDMVLAVSPVVATCVYSVGSGLVSTVIYTDSVPFEVWASDSGLYCVGDGGLMGLGYICVFVGPDEVPVRFVRVGACSWGVVDDCAVDV